MDVTQYYADSPPAVVPLTINPHFEALTEQKKLYAHHISRLVKFGTCWRMFYLSIPVPSYHQSFEKRECTATIRSLA